MSFRMNVFAAIPDGAFTVASGGHVILFDDASCDEVIRQAWMMHHDKTLEPEFTRAAVRQVCDQAQQRCREIEWETLQPDF